MIRNHRASWDGHRFGLTLGAGAGNRTREAWYRQAIPLAEQRYEDYLEQEDIR